MIRQLLSSYLPRNQPWITRQSYSHELITALTFPVAMSMLQGGVMGILAKKTFEVGPMLFATIMSAPMFANMTSFLWARLSRGQGKVRFINVLQMMMLISIGAVAVLPTNGVGRLLLTSLVILSCCLATGIITIRSTVWRMNYPRRVRAQVTGRLALISSLLLAMAPLVGYALLDQNPQAFRLVYPICILIALVGVMAFSHVRLRGERQLLRYEAGPAARPQPHGTPGSIYEYDAQSGRDGFWTVLQRDPFFRRYMLWQFLGGMGVMMGEVIIIYQIAELTCGLRHQYLISILLATALPMLLSTTTMPICAKYLDRVHVARLRARLGLLWILAQILYWVGAMHFSLGIIALGRVLSGLTRGGGMLAWNLGHNDFADRRLVAIYMGVHVTLTGVRGALAPFLAMVLYIGWSDRTFTWPGLAVGGFVGISHHVFFVTTLIAIFATIGFHFLDLAIQRGQAAPTQKPLARIPG